MKRLQMTATAAATLWLLNLGGCSQPPPPPAPPPAQPTAPPKPEPKPEPKAEEPAPKPKTLKPELADLTKIPRPAAPAGLEKAAKLLGEGKWQEARDELEANIDTHRRKGTLDVKVQAYAMLGFARWQLDDMPQAERAYRRVISYANRPDKQIQKETTDEKEAEKRLAAVMQGIAEAVFFLAEKRRSKVDEIPFPSYEGEGTPEDVERWADRKVKLWAIRRQRAVERARDEYLKLTELDPLPGPWVVAAASRTGAMWANAAHQCMEASVPAKLEQEGSSTIAKTGEETAATEAKQPATADAGAEAGTAEPATFSWEELRDMYEAAVAKHCGIFVERATEAYEKCQEHGQSHDPEGALAKTCTAWLETKP